MTYWDAIVLGFVQGVAEFLPISSSGHLAILQNFLQLGDLEEHLFFDVLLHLGTLGAVLFAFWKDVRELVSTGMSMLGNKKHGHGNKAERINQRMIWFLVIATLPLVFAAICKDLISGLYANPFFIGFALIVTGFLLFAADRMGHGDKDVRSCTISDAVIVGIAQAVAVVPGLSRSGTTIATGMLRGFDRSFAVRFSFLLSIPAVIGANLFTFIDAVQAEINWSNMPMYLVGVLTAFVFGYCSIYALRMIVQRGKFGGFSYYCWGAGLLTLLLSLVS